MKRGLTMIIILLCVAICSTVTVFAVGANAAVWSLSLIHISEPTRPY